MPGLCCSCWMIAVRGDSSRRHIVACDYIWAWYTPKCLSVHTLLKNCTDILLITSQNVPEIHFVKDNFAFSRKIES